MKYFPHFPKGTFVKWIYVLDFIFLFLALNNLARIKGYQHTENHVIERILSLAFKAEGKKNIATRINVSVTTLMKSRNPTIEIHYEQGLHVYFPLG